jgi:hypothetical protein
MEHRTYEDFQPLVDEDKKDLKEGLFLNSTHRALFYEFIRRDNVNLQDRERTALFYIISGCPDLVNKGSHKIYDFTEHRLKFSPEEKYMERYLEQFALCSSSSSLLRLACNLYNNLYPSQSVNDTFSNLDEDNIHLALTAIRIRFEKNVI